MLRDDPERAAAMFAETRLQGMPALGGYATHGPGLEGYYQKLGVVFAKGVSAGAGGGGGPGALVDWAYGAVVFGGEGGACGGGRREAREGDTRRQGAGCRWRRA